MQLSQTAAGQLAYPVALSLDSPTHAIATIIRPLVCNDGMSDRLHPWTADLVIQSGGRQGFLTGCCNLPYDAGQH